VSELLGIARFTFHEGKVEEFKRLSEECMEIVRTQDAGTLQYDIYFNDDESEAIVIERLPELHRTATFGSRSLERLEILRRHQPTGPLMCMEFWNGWFDSWGLPHHVAAPEANAADLDDLLAAGGSVNLYMFHGGTNLGLTNGANDKGRYLPVTTSYDYDAPLAENGTPTAKYRAMRDVISRHAPVPDEEPAPSPAAPVLDLALDRRTPLWDVLPGAGAPSDGLPTADDLRQWSGFTLYRTDVRADDAVLSLAEVRDRGLVFLDRQPVGVLSRGDGVLSVPLPAQDGELAVLLEDEGRVNYGPRLGEAKGLFGPARTAVRELRAWAAAPVDLDPERLAKLLAEAPFCRPGRPGRRPRALRGYLHSAGRRRPLPAAGRMDEGARLGQRRPARPVLRDWAHAHPLRAGPARPRGRERRDGARAAGSSHGAGAVRRRRGPRPHRILTHPTGRQCRRP